MTTLVPVVLSAVLAYQAPPPVPAAPAPQTKQAQPPSAAKRPAVPRPAAQPAAPADAEIETAIRARLAKSKIASNGFTVRVQGGVAYLDGKTGVLQHKGTATRLAKNAGAAKVVNNIEVSDAAKEKARSNLASGRRRVQVKRSEVPGRT